MIHNNLTIHKYSKIENPNNYVLKYLLIGID